MSMVMLIGHINGLVKGHVNSHFNGHVSGQGKGLVNGLAITVLKNYLYVLKFPKMSLPHHGVTLPLFNRKNIRLSIYL